MYTHSTQHQYTDGHPHGPFIDGVHTSMKNRVYIRVVIFMKQKSYGHVSSQSTRASLGIEIIFVFVRYRKIHFWALNILYITVAFVFFLALSCFASFYLFLSILLENGTNDISSCSPRESLIISLKCFEWWLPNLSWIFRQRNRNAILTCSNPHGQFLFIIESSLSFIVCNSRWQLTLQMATYGSTSNLDL